MTSSRASKTAKSKATGITSARDVVPDVYREMLANAATSSPTQTSDDGRPIKRRRVGGRIVTQRHDGPASHQSDQSCKTDNDSDLDELFEDVTPHRQQILQTESEDSADSDLDWEEVVSREGVKQEGTPERETDKLGELHLVLGQEGQESKLSRQQRLKRKPATAEEKRLRLEIHKLHLCSLIAHVYTRNHWCNDGKVHTALKKLLTKRIISYLNPDEGQSQFQRSRSFMDGLKQASDAFRLTFKITARGLSKPRWADNPETLAQVGNAQVSHSSWTCSYSDKTRCSLQTTSIFQCKNRTFAMLLVASKLPVMSVLNCFAHRYVQLASIPDWSARCFLYPFSQQRKSLFSKRRVVRLNL